MFLRNDHLGAVPAVDTAEQERERLRICMMVTYDMASPGGGVKHHAQHLAAALRRRGDDVMIVGPSSAPSDDPFVQTFGGIVNVPANGSDNKLSLFVSPVSIAKFFRQHKFDVIHVHEPLQPALSYWSVWATRQIPHVATFHAFAETEGTPFKWARKVWGATIFPWFQRAIAVSHPAARYASDAWYRPLSIIPNGVPTDIFTPPAPVNGHHHVNGPAHVNGHAPAANGQQPIVKLLFVGRIGDRRKGARYLFDAYRNLVAKKLPVTLDVVGELGEAEPPPQLPGLTYHGAVDLPRLTELYRGCDVFVAPSTGQESFGIVLLEAMASAKPVVCSDIEGYRQVAVREGSALVPPGDVAALESAITDMVMLDPQIRAHKGQINRTAAETYDWDRISERVRTEYLAAISSHRNGTRT
jgi:phosphatidylinositol alpha-mannosyltransferase